jgi:GTP-binding protein
VTRPTLELERTVYLLDQLAALPAPQIALAGRSNVGKSSLVNALAGRRKLAKTSATPGKTQSLNFYRAQPWGFYLVDLPGYGYARVSKTERAKWARLVDAYIANNPWLRAVAVLLDARHPPQKNDMDLIGYIQGKGVAVLPVLTKADKTKQRDREAVRKQWALLLDSEKPLATSSQTGLGVDALWAVLREVALGPGAGEPHGPEGEERPAPGAEAPGEA